MKYAGTRIESEIYVLIDAEKFVRMLQKNTILPIYDLFDETAAKKICSETIVKSLLKKKFEKKRLCYVEKKSL
jgi:hypothetical protein